MDIDEWQQHITIDVAITSTDGMAIMSTARRATTFIGRITQRITGVAFIMCIGLTTRYITGAKAITSSGIMCIAKKGITFIARRATTFTDARGITFIAYDMQRRDIVRCTHDGHMYERRV